MKVKTAASLLLAIVFAAGPLASQAADAASQKPKPYPLKTCIVSDEKLREMGKPYVFTYEGQEIKLCCKSCKKDFDKDPKKFLKKLESAKKKK